MQIIFNKDKHNEVVNSNPQISQVTEEVLQLTGQFEFSFCLS